MGSKEVIAWRKRRKIDLVELFSNKCFFCNGVFPPEIYDFHHINCNKEFSISASTKSFKKLIEEAKKCVMLCSNCHRLVHNNYITIDIYYETILDEKLIKQMLKVYKDNRIKNQYKKQYECKNCGKKTTNKYFCNDECRAFYRRKVEWPSKEELTELLKNNSRVKIGKMYNVSEAAVRKWIKKYGVAL